MTATNFAPLPEESGQNGRGITQTFADVWARKYLQKLAEQDDITEALNRSERAAEIAHTLMQTLRATSAQAWAKTEALLAQELVRHQIDPRSIDPWAVAKDAHQIYEIALNAYAQQLPPPQLSTLIAAPLGQIRQKYTASDPRIIGFVSMQFHYSEQILLDLTPPTQQALLSQYFKVIDDHLYMPLQRAYQAAADHSYPSFSLQAVQRLVPLCNRIASKIVTRVSALYPDYYCHTGRLNQPYVQIWVVLKRKG